MRELKLRNVKVICGRTEATWRREQLTGDNLQKFLNMNNNKTVAPGNTDVQNSCIKIQYLTAIPMIL